MFSISCTHKHRQYTFFLKKIKKSLDKSFFNSDNGVGIDDYFDSWRKQ